MKEKIKVKIILKITVILLIAVAAYQIFFTDLNNKSAKKTDLKDVILLAEEGTI